MARFMTDDTSDTDTPMSDETRELLAAAGSRPQPQDRRRGASESRWPGSPPVRVNKYPGVCPTCQRRVEANEGQLVNEDGRWVVSHVSPCPPQDQQSATQEPTPFAVPEGRYTVVWADEHKTIRVRRQDEDATFRPGETLLGYLSGSDNVHDYANFAHVEPDGSVKIWHKHQDNPSLREAVKVLLGNPRAASRAYAQRSGTCGVCGRDLTTPDSLAKGIGPTCAARLGWV